MNKKYSLNKYTIFGLLVAAYCIYYLMLRDIHLPFSIPNVCHSVYRLVNQWPALAVGLLPVYVALMIFGIAGLGFYLGSLLERFALWLSQRYFTDKISQESE